MDKLMNQPEFVRAGMISWNQLTAIFDDPSATKFTSAKEFKEFYSLLIDRLLEEEKSA